MIKNAIIELTKLIHLFHSNIKEYKKSTYDEANTRVDFIDKFFELLDWDVRNTQGYSEIYREVVREDKVIVEGKPKAPDYSFRIGGRKFFFVEAKKPCVNIKEDRDPAFQVRRYGYTAKLSLSILTDFEEFAVYDTRIKPNKNDKASVARVFYCDFMDLLKQNNINPEITNFEYIYSIFSKEAILKGSFDRYIEENKKKKGTSEVDKEILNLIDNWRCELARNIALRNKELDVHNLNLAVQKIIDRIIFLRIAEDRNMEKYGSLQVITKENDVYKKLISIFIKAENKYDSGLFAGENWLNDLLIDDKVISSMIKSFYYPECPYELSILPIEILGNTYEQFLGKKIRLTDTHQAKIEEKPEVRKAGGVYYTPQYIVDYIVENTVGEKIKRKKPEDIESLTVLDPACGSGSFLVRAYSFLLKHHIKYYCQKSKIDTALKKGKIYQVDETTYYLSTSEKQNILLNNIYGVDIDEQAVEVTKLSLLLKLMENENIESEGMLFKHSDLKILPDLSNNIKCGNSLIGSDFYDDKNLSLFDKEEMRKVNAFDWDKEFPEIFARGGFDCVVGNPPYLRIQGLQEYHGQQIDYFIEKYKSAIKRFDLYILFLEKAFKLLSENGKLGYICPHKFLNSDAGSGIRDIILKNKSLERIISFGHNLIFQNASTYTGLVFLSNNNNIFKYFEFSNIEKNISILINNLSDKDYAIYELNNLKSSAWALTSKKLKLVLDKIFSQPDRIENTFKMILQGVVTGIDDIYFLKKLNITNEKSDTLELYSEYENQNIKIEKELLKPILKGDDIKKYSPLNYVNYCIYPYKIVNKKTVILEEKEFSKLYPLGFSYLKKYKKILTNLRIKFKTNPKYWYSCHRSRPMELFEDIRIITPYASLGCNMTLSAAGIYHNTKVYSIIPLDKYNNIENKYFWMGIFNSKIMWFFMKNTGYVLRGGYFTFTSDYLKPFPIKLIDFNNKKEKSQHDNMVSLVGQMLEAQKEYQSAKSEADKNFWKKKIELLDRQIDNLVYELYELTPEEIKIVEESV